MNYKVTLRIILSTIVLLLNVLLIITMLLPSAGAETMYVCVDEDSWLNGRANPDIHSDVECRFYLGDEVEVIDIYGEWAKVDEGGEAKHSWVLMKYLSSDIYESDTNATVVSNGRVRVRTSPGGEIIGYVNDGDTVKVKSSYEEWIRTNLGWISKDYLDICK